MTDQQDPKDDGYDADLLAAANDRLQRARTGVVKLGDAQLLMGAIAAAEREMSRFWDEAGQPDAAELARQDRALRFTALELAREQVPAHFRGPRAELAAHIPPKLLRAVDSWRWGDDNLLLLGPSRVGKTTAAAYLLRRLLGLGVHHGGEALERAKLIRWQSCRELTYAIREFPLGQGTPEVLQRCENARLLILDDIGLSDDKGALERIMDVRYLRSWPTITTSGLRYRELVKTFGEALVRRLHETKNHGGRILQVFPDAEVAA